MFIRKYFSFSDFYEASYGTVRSLVVEMLTGYPESSVTPAEVIDLANLLVLDAAYESILYVDYNPVFETEPTKVSDSVLEKKAEFINKMRFIYLTTKDKYKTLLDAYTAQKNKLFDKIGVRNTTQYNDTPQTTMQGLDGDGYASTYTVSNSVADFNPVERLAEVNRLYQNVMRDWVDEFKGLIIEVN